MYFILKHELKYTFHSSAVIIHPLLDIRPESIDFWLFWARKAPVPFRNMVKHRAKSNLKKKSLFKYSLEIMKAKLALQQALLKLMVLTPFWSVYSEVM